MKTCPHCKGSGSVYTHDDYPCPTCNATGKVPENFNEPVIRPVKPVTPPAERVRQPINEFATCPNCRGVKDFTSHDYTTDSCSLCNGTGNVRRPNVGDNVTPFKTQVPVPSPAAVVPLNVVTDDQRWRQQVVDYLQAVLDMAKAGKIARVMILRETDDGKLVASWSGYERLDTRLGQIEILKHQLIDEQG